MVCHLPQSMLIRIGSYIRRIKPKFTLKYLNNSKVLFSRSPDSILRPPIYCISLVRQSLSAQPLILFPFRKHCLIIFVFLYAGQTVDGPRGDSPRGLCAQLREPSSIPRPPQVGTQRKEKRWRSDRQIFLPILAGEAVVESREDVRDKCCSQE